MSSFVQEIRPGVFRLRDTCNVYVVRAPEKAPDGSTTGIAIDFGSGAVLDHLEEMGIDRITDVLMTHHHRDQGQGLPRAVESGIAIHVPPIEQDLFAQVDQMWTTRNIVNDYNLRQDRFSILDPVPIAGTVPEYRSANYGGVDVQVEPTPGHTTGSVTYIVERAGERIAFSGDLIYAPGKVWSLAATQWSYTENEGPAMTVLSCILLQRQNLDLLLPSHGEAMWNPNAALDLLADRMQHYVDSRRPQPWDLRERLDNPYVAITDHFLLNRSSVSCSYVLISKTGAALVIDYGYDMTTGLPAGQDRAARRPWLASLPALRERYGVNRIEVALPTHYHDDHIAGFNLLRDVEGTEVWSPENVAPILDDPMFHDLPCQWYEPIPSDRLLPLDQEFTWREYTIKVHDLPGHTLYAAAFEFEVDGVRVLVTGDQQDGLGMPGSRREILNYQYRNRLGINDYRRSAQLYRDVAPGVMVSGHWEPRWVDEDYLNLLAEQADELANLHEELLPLEEYDLGTDGILARVSPYYSQVAPGNEATFRVSIRNPHSDAAEAHIAPVLPDDWHLRSEIAPVQLSPGEELEVDLQIGVSDSPQRRARLAVDVTIGDLRLGQHAEAIVDIG
ncbi:MAG TPA: MBL fold metallo-hydrolase [Actinomycetales bacterium]|nr:MBL fold metallo-hydrolase [Actinomycetales bacterium]